jgi:uncharacterized membrane protein (Fun14 family)
MARRYRRLAMVSMLRGVTWLYVGTLVAIGATALFTLCYSLLKIALSLATSVVGQLPGS